jgi:hypothetical protein
MNEYLNNFEPVLSGNLAVFTQCISERNNIRIAIPLTSIATWNRLKTGLHTLLYPVKSSVPFLLRRVAGLSGPQHLRSTLPLRLPVVLADRECHL